MIQLNTQSELPEPTRYFIVQHMPDVFRREVHNVGVIVEQNGKAAAKFLGEDNSGQLDGRKLKRVSSVAVYRLWIDYWRKAFEKEGWQQSIEKKSVREFAVVAGGEVDSSTQSDAESVCSYLFRLLVSQGGFEEAIASPVDEMEDAIVPVSREVRMSFKSRGILEMGALESVVNPVRENAGVPGAKRWEIISYVQRSLKEEWLIEPINLLTTKKKIARTRAGYIAHMFDDIRSAKATQPRKRHFVAVYRVDPSDANNDDVKYSLSVLGDSCDLVNWSVLDERDKFMLAREQLAYSS